MSRSLGVAGYCICRLHLLSKILLPNSKRVNLSFVKGIIARAVNDYDHCFCGKKCYIEYYNFVRFKLSR